MDLNEGIVTLTNTITNEDISVKADLVFGVDGAFSAVRYNSFQSSIMDEIMALPNIEAEWDSKIVMDILLEKSSDFKF